MSGFEPTLQCCFVNSIASSFVSNLGTLFGNCRIASFHSGASSSKQNTLRNLERWLAIVTSN